MEESHGLWKRRIVVVIGYPTANHYLACSLYAPLTTAFWRIREVAERQPPFFLLPRPVLRVLSGYILRRARAASMETARRSDTSQLIKAFTNRGHARIRNALYHLIWPANLKGPIELCIHRGQYHQSRRSGWLRQHYLKRESYR